MRRIMWFMLASVLAINLLPGCAKETEKGRQLRLSAEKGDAKAQLQLGWAYGGDGSGRYLKEGSALGISPDETKSVFWIRKAADQGDATAQCLLGIRYYNGSGIPKDSSEAIRWLSLSAAQGNAYGQDMLGSMYSTGDGVPKNSAEALKWFRASAEQGFADAENNLGSMYATGRGVPKDSAEGIKWLLKAAAEGNAESEHSLGAIYFNGDGVPKSIPEATKWMRLAAEKGNADAQEALVILSKPQPIQIDAIQLISEYEANEIRADSAYKGKIVTVSGYVTTVGKDILGHAYVALRGGESQLGQVQCLLKPEAIAQASTLNPGQSVTVTGSVEGKMMNVVLEDCSF